MERGGHANRGHVARPMRARLDVIESGEVGDLLHRGEPTAMDHAHEQVVDQLLSYQLLRIPDAVEKLPQRQGRGGVLPGEPETNLQRARHRVFEPEEMIRFERLTQARRLNGS